MSDKEITLINDGEGLAVIGESSTVERFVASLGAGSQEMELPRLGSLAATGSGLTQAASDIATQSGRWIKLSEKSAKELAKGTPMKGSEPGLSRAILQENGRNKMILEFVRTPGSAVANPAVLAGAAEMMAQLAMQQTMSEITDYLATIDAKLDDVLRGQKDAVVADMVGVGMVIDEAMTIREGVGGVSEVTWSKVQSTAHTIAKTQAYALAQIDDLTQKLARQRRVNAIAESVREVEAKIDEWLMTLARCFQLQDGMSVLELDRLFAVSPHEVDAHRRALQLARQNRRDQIAQTTEALLGRLTVAATTANAKVLFNPLDTRNALTASQQVSTKVNDFQQSIGILGGGDSLTARRWREAASDVKDRVVHTGQRGASRATRVGGQAATRVRSTASTASRGITDRVRRSDQEQDTL